MLMVLNNLKPGRVMKYFEDICAIPRGSGDTDRIAAYCMDFAAAHGLSAVRDASNNVVIRKPASNGCTSDKTVMIQGHLDMVCARESDCDIDFKTDGLRLTQDGEYIWADGTSLGGDDGIAVAMALAVLEANDIVHPALECVFTTDEEVGMLGAMALDMSWLKSDYLLNIDSEDEGIFTVSCAGGATVTSVLKGDRLTGKVTDAVKITVDGLIGGHSGVEIDKGRANACIVLGKVLAEISEKTEIKVIELNGGEKDNAIARSAYAIVCAENTAEVFAEAERQNKLFREKFSLTDSGIRITAEQAETKLAPLDCDIVRLLSSAPNGVQKMSEDIEGLPQTSLNLGILRTVGDTVTVSFSVRSSVAAEKEQLIDELLRLTEECGGTIELAGGYPAWEYKKDSVLRDKCAELFFEQYSRAPEISAIHAGLECGIFSSGMPGIECISFGPDILDIHTPKESLSIKSTERVYDFLIKLLERL